MTRALAIAALLLFAPAAHAETSAEEKNARPSEDELFGDNTASQPAASAKPAPTPAPPAKAEEIPEDPLKIGGQFYLRAMGTSSDEVPASKWGFSAPTLVDGYLDARPNDRVRAFLLTRLAFDPTVPESGTPAGTANAPFVSTKQLEIMLDQLWLRFDIARVIYVTAGRQHVKWGPAHFWNPTDFLHQLRRNPLDPFDARIGSTMVKVQVPWEKHGWNLYGLGLLEDTAPDGTLGKIGGGARGEVVLGPAEIGAEAIFQRGHKPRLGADLSAGLGPIDVYAEASLRKGWDQATLWRPTEGSDPTLGLAGSYEQWQPNWALQATGGLSWSLNYMDVNVLTFGAEYFYNSVGYSNATIYPWLIAQNAFTPFYTGQHYVGVYGVFTGPATVHNLGLALSNIANLSDRSSVLRLDASVIVLTHLRVEAYTAMHYGNKGGEFRFSMDSPATDTLPAFSVPTPLVEFGVGLRVSI